MTTTIDAAIIKTLVEHIGGDSSTIPDGVIGGTSGPSTLKHHFEPLPNSNYNRDLITLYGPSCTIELPIDEFVPGHTVLRLKRKDSQGTIDTWLCTNIISMSKTRYDVVLTFIEDVETMKLSATEIIELQYYGNSSSDNSTSKPHILSYGSRNFNTIQYEESVNWTDEDEVGPYLIAVDDEHGLSATSNRINYNIQKLLISFIEKPNLIAVG